jgi:hypothetical protein
MTNQGPHLIDQLLRDFVAEMQWDSDRTDLEKTLVMGNLNGLAGRIKSRLTTEDQLREVLSEQCAAAGGQKAWAKLHGVSPQYVCDVLQGRRDAGEAICTALGLRRVVHYEPDTGPLLRQAAEDFLDAMSGHRTAPIIHEDIK